MEAYSQTLARPTGLDERDENERHSENDGEMKKTFIYATSNQFYISKHITVSVNFYCCTFIDSVADQIRQKASFVL